MMDREKNEGCVATVDSASVTTSEKLFKTKMSSHTGLCPFSPVLEEVSCYLKIQR